MKLILLIFLQCFSLSVYAVFECSLDRVFRYDFGYRKIRHVVEHYPSTINYPRAITADNDGNIYVGDSVSYKIIKFDRNGKLVKIFPLVGDKDTNDEEGDIIYSLSVDHANNVYAINVKKQRLEVYTNNGKHIRSYDIPWAKIYSKNVSGDSYKYSIVIRDNDDILLVNYDSFVNFVIHASNGHIEDISQNYTKVTSIEENETNKPRLHYKAVQNSYIAEIVSKNKVIGACSLIQLSEFSNNWHISKDNKLYVVTEKKVSIYNLDLE